MSNPKSVVVALPNIILLEQQIPQNQYRLKFATNVLFICFEQGQYRIALYFKMHAAEFCTIFSLKSEGVLDVSEYIMFHAFLYLLF